MYAAGILVCSSDACFVAAIADCDIAASLRAAEDAAATRAAADRTFCDNILNCSIPRGTTDQALELLITRNVERYHMSLTIECARELIVGRSDGNRTVHVCRQIDIRWYRSASIINGFSKCSHLLVSADSRIVFGKLVVFIQDELRHLETIIRGPRFFNLKHEELINAW